jgi:N6-adenosine-specific RNA methylase IME4
MSGTGKYRTIVADPPWHYDGRAIGGRLPGTLGETQPFPYGTLQIDELAALPIRYIAAEDAVLWLWTTNRWLPESFDVMAAWGFRYRQTLVWGKNNPMPVGGSVAPPAAEFLLVGKRGNPPVNMVFPSSVIITPRPPARSHSAKPECFIDWIEQASPTPWLELFARRQRLGWDTWGNEALEHVTLGAAGAVDE